MTCEGNRASAQALFFLRVAAALAAVARRLRVAAALRPAARRSSFVLPSDRM